MITLFDPSLPSFSIFFPTHLSQVCVVQVEQRATPAASKVSSRRKLAQSICLMALEFPFLFEFITTFVSWDGNV